MSYFERVSSNQGAGVSSPSGRAFQFNKLAEILFSLAVPFNERLCHSFASSLSECARFQAVRTLVRRACVPFESDEVCYLTEIDPELPVTSVRYRAAR
jgi:hypothetical protein